MEYIINYQTFTHQIVTFFIEDSLRNEHHNQYQDDISENPTPTRDDYNDDIRGFKPSQPIVGVVKPTSNYHSDYSTNYLPQSTEQEEQNQYSYSKQNNRLSHLQTDIDFNMDRFMGKNIPKKFL